VLAPGQWFVYDEFDYFRAGDEPLLLWLLRPHNEHTIAVTKVWFGALLPIVGLRAYDLYLAPLVVAHIIVIGAIHHLCGTPAPRRCSPWGRQRWQPRWARPLAR
jgi:hypothetical protein